MGNKSHIKARVLDYIKYREISKYEFYKKSGITRSVLDKESGLSEDNILKVITYDPRISLRWLVKGEGPMFATSESLSLVQEPDAEYNALEHALVQSQSVPLYDLKTVKSLVTIFNRKAAIKPVSYIHVPSLPECDGAVYVTEDGMNPFLKEGDIIMYKKVQIVAKNMLWGEMYLVSTNTDGEEDVSVRWIQRSDRGPKYAKLVPENKQYRTLEMPARNILALALVKASIQINNPKPKLQ